MILKPFSLRTLFTDTKKCANCYIIGKNIGEASASPVLFCTILMPPLPCSDICYGVTLMPPMGCYEAY